MKEEKNNKFRFTKEQLMALTPTERRERYYDAKIESLILEVLPSGRKVFRVYKRIKGRSSPVNISLGTFPGMSIEHARSAALESLALISAGVNQNEKLRENKLAARTLKEVFEEYIGVKKLKPKTLIGYKQAYNAYISDWHALDLAKISEQKVKERHSELTIRSPAQADLCMRLIRALFNFAKFQYRTSDGDFIFENNPTSILGAMRLWNNVPRKQSRIAKNDMAEWLKAINERRACGDLFTVGVCDFLEVTWLTGLRKMEILSLKWSQVNLEAKTLLIDESKNGYRLLLPISDHLYTIFERRRCAATSHYVFEAENSWGYIREPKKHIAQLIEVTGIKFTLHDLRRTFTSTAELLKIGTYTLKRLLNHKTNRDDVTAGYTVLTAEELREPAQLIENRLLELAGVKAKEHSDLSVLFSKLSESERNKLAELLFESRLRDRGWSRSEG